MSHQHTLSTVDHGLLECTGCDMRVRGTTGTALPECAREGCTEEGQALIGFEVVCIPHAMADLQPRQEVA